MMINALKKIVVSFTLILLLVLATLMLAPTNAVAAASPTLLGAKKEAESKGYIFFTTHDEIVAMAKKEGKLGVMTNLDTPNLEPLIKGFKQKYPFIGDINIERMQGSDVYQRFLLEIKAGQAKKWDVVTTTFEFAREYMEYYMKQDIFGMAKHGVLKIDPRMVYPDGRNLLSFTSTILLGAYNKTLISEDKVPTKWEDFLKPEFKGKKFVLDIRPVPLAALVPAWGLEKVLDFARKLAAQQPVWARGNSRGVAFIAGGEYPIFFGPHLGAAKEAVGKDPASMSYKVIEPVPTMALDHSGGILKTADHPCAALLWLEFLVTPEAQQIIDKYEPFRASVFSSGSVVSQEVRGKKLSVVDWNHFAKFDGYTAKIFEAYGFPKAQ